MMSKTYEGQKLQPGFTFRIVEMVKHIKIQPAPRTPWLPFGLSAATGIVLTVLMFSPHLMSLTPLGALLGSPMPSETKVMEVGELPVDVLEISEITFLSSEKGDGNDGAKKLPNPQNALAPPLAPSGKRGKWTKKADMPTARTFLSTSVVNKKIYAIGGRSVNANLPTVEEYDPAAGTWTKKADMPTARRGLSTSVVNGKIYAIGGYAVSYTSAVEEYDPATDTWTKKTSMPAGGRFGLSTSVVDGKIYAIGGWNAGEPVSIVEEYDPAADTWTRKADMPTARAMLSTSLVNGNIYAIGGYAGNFPNFVSLSNVEKYNPATDTWTKEADMPTARDCFSASVVNGKIYIIGGGALGNSVMTPIVEEYAPAAGTWTKKADIPTVRLALSTSIVNGKIYAIGGTNAHLAGDVFSTVEEYTPEGWPFSVSPHGNLST